MYRQLMSRFHKVLNINKLNLLIWHYTCCYGYSLLDITYYQILQICNNGYEQCIGKSVTVYFKKEGVKVKVFANTLSFFILLSFKYNIRIKCMSYDPFCYSFICMVQVHSSKLQL